MDKEEEYFHKIADKLSKEYKFVKTGKMMSAPGTATKRNFLHSTIKKKLH